MLYIIFRFKIMTIGLLSLHLHLPGCTSLKQKRSRIRPVITRLHSEFNVSTAEIALQDTWQESIIAVCLVCNDSQYAQQALQKIAEFTVYHWSDLEVVDHRIEII